MIFQVVFFAHYLTYTPLYPIFFLLKRLNMSMTKRFLEEMETLMFPDDLDFLDQEYEIWLEKRNNEQHAYEEMLEINPNFAQN
jgi:hypothetical protein